MLSVVYCAFLICCYSVLQQTRHRAVNLFLQGYEKSWIEAEEHYFEDKLIEDLAVSSFSRASGLDLDP